MESTSERQELHPDESNGLIPQPNHQQQTPHLCNLLKQDKIDKIIELKYKIDSLINNIRDSKSVCDKYDNEIQYFQEYIGGLMKK